MRSELDQIPGLEPMIKDVVRRMQSDLDSFIQDIEDGDVDSIREAAHKSKGLLGMYGFPTLADLYSRCERLCVTDGADAKRQDQLTHIVSDIRRLVADVRTSYSLH